MGIGQIGPIGLIGKLGSPGELGKMLSTCLAEDIKLAPREKLIKRNGSGLSTYMIDDESKG